MAERAKQSNSMLDLPEDEDISPERIGNQVQKAQEQLLQLKRQQEALEKQKLQLEELSKRQDALQHGRTEMVEKITRAMVVVERETHDAQKRVEQLQTIQESFMHHLSLLEAINPKAWETTEVNKELNKSLSAVDDARAEYAKTLPKISPEGSDDHIDAAAAEAYGYAYAPEKDFMYWVKAGFGFTLPLLALGIILLIVLLAHFTPS